MKAVTVRIPEENFDEIEKACKQEDIARSSMIRKLIEYGLKKYHED